MIIRSGPWASGVRLSAEFAGAIDQKDVEDEDSVPPMKRYSYVQRRVAYEYSQGKKVI